jgi:hypothetical protein
MRMMMSKFVCVGDSLITFILLDVLQNQSIVFDGNVGESCEAV